MAANADFAPSAYLWAKFEHGRKTGADGLALARSAATPEVFMGTKRQPGNFHFDISLSVLNHLGRNLYRSFATVLGEGLSNSWDADATNVHIVVDPRTSSLCITDDGHGMTADDFQEKFLKIGYSKRREAKTSPGRHRPSTAEKGSES